jgi:hypothetical protein
MTVVIHPLPQKLRLVVNHRTCANMMSGGLGTLHSQIFTDFFNFLKI